MEISSTNARFSSAILVKTRGQWFWSTTGNLAPGNLGSCELPPGARHRVCVVLWFVPWQTSMCVMHKFLFGCGSKNGSGSLCSDPYRWIDLDHLCFGMDRGFFIACGDGSKHKGVSKLTYWCLVGNGWEWGNGMIIHSYCGSFPHSLLSTSK